MIEFVQPEPWNLVICILLLIVSYLLGSIPFGLVIGKAITGVDIRSQGSKNIGSTNAVRVLGKKVGALVFLCDVLKGALVIIVVKILSATGVWSPWMDPGFFGTAAVIGHSYSCFLKFKGGKAVATSLGVVLCICPLAGIACLIAFVITLKTTGYVSLASTFAEITVFIGYLVLFFVGYHGTSFGEYFISAPTLLAFIAILVPGIIIIYKHIPNYKRLIAGTENSFKKKKVAPVEETVNTSETESLNK